MYPALKNHLERLALEPHAVHDRHLKSQRDLVRSIISLWRKNGQVFLIMVCTGNSRRSMMGAAMGNAAAAFYGLEGIRFFSGGTKPSAFNTRSIKALSGIGFEICATGEKAADGVQGEVNHRYVVQWAQDQNSSISEFSKKYNDPFNPQKDFIAVMVCDEADMECPSVVGASARISLPFADPKEFDGTPMESAKYAERRDDLGRFMLSTFQLVSEELKKQGH